MRELAFAPTFFASSSFLPPRILALRRVNADGRGRFAGAQGPKRSKMPTRRSVRLQQSSCPTMPTCKTRRAPPPRPPTPGSCVLIRKAPKVPAFNLDDMESADELDMMKDGRTPGKLVGVVNCQPPPTKTLRKLGPVMLLQVSEFGTEDTDSNDELDVVEKCVPEDMKVKIEPKLERHASPDTKKGMMKSDDYLEEFRVQAYAGAFHKQGLRTRGDCLELARDCRLDRGKLVRVLEDLFPTMPAWKRVVLSRSLVEEAGS